jgi:hypothetical protein
MTAHREHRVCSVLIPVVMPVEGQAYAGGSGVDTLSTMKSHYPAQVFWQAAEVLATGNEPAKTRLWSAAIIMVTRLQPEELEGSFRQEYETLLKSLTADPRNDHEGSLKTTIDTMAERKVTETIELIIRLYGKAARLDPMSEKYE